MSQESLRTTITVLQDEIKQHYVEADSLKEVVNRLCKSLHEPPLYTDIGEKTAGGATATRSDEFYGKPLATVVRSILERRQRANLGAATVPEIYKVMKEGGFHFEAKNVANAQRALHIALAKNTTTFHRLPDSKSYGLREWYPTVKDRSKPEASNGAVAVDTEATKTTPAPPQQPLHEELQNAPAAAPAKRARRRQPAPK